MTRRTPQSLALRVLAVFAIAQAIGWPSAPSASGQSGEPIPIADLREYPEQHHLHQVLVRGTVRDVRAFDPYKLPAGSVCYGAYSFRLDDETGTLPVIVMGICGVPIVKDPEVDEGDVLTAQITVHAPGKGTFFLTLDGRKMPFSDTADVQGVATNIWPISKATTAQDPTDHEAAPVPAP